MTVTVQNTASPLASAFTAARKVAVPLIVVRTNDPAASVETISLALHDTKPAGEKPLLVWDTLNGLRPANSTGQAAMAKFIGAGQQPTTIAFAETLVLLQKAPASTCVLAHNAHLQWSGADIKQGIWNLRDQFKTNQRTLVLLTTPGAAVPSELVNDVITINEPAPTPEQLGDVVRSIYQSVNQSVDDTTIKKSVDALSGARALFTAEQITAMSMTKQGVDLDALWAQKKELVNDTPGLLWIDPQFAYADLGGLDAAKKFFTRMFEGEQPPTAIILLDEFDDMMAGVGGDTSGVSTEIQGIFLTWMVRTRAKGVLCVGHPGVGKSAIAEATAAEFGVPFIEFNLSKVKRSHVGESEENMTRALDTLDAISRGRALFVGTANSVGNLTPQLQSRFGFRFFFDLPTQEEKNTIWPVYEKRPSPDATKPLSAAQLKDRPDDSDWTGREIAKCAEYASMFRCTLKEAAQYVVPIAVSMPEQIDARRKEAANRYLSASYAGPYRLKGETVVKVTTVPSRLPRALANMDES